MLRLQKLHLLLLAPLQLADRLALTAHLARGLEELQVELADLGLEPPDGPRALVGRLTSDFDVLETRGALGARRTRGLRDPRGTAGNRAGRADSVEHFVAIATRLGSRPGDPGSPRNRALVRVHGEKRLRRARPTGTGVRRRILDELRMCRFRGARRLVLFCDHLGAHHVREPGRRFLQQRRLHLELRAHDGSRVVQVESELSHFTGGRGNRLGLKSEAFALFDRKILALALSGVLLCVQRLRERLRAFSSALFSAGGRAFLGIRL